jgi:hypothetical protein
MWGHRARSAAERIVHLVVVLTLLLGVQFPCVSWSGVCCGPCLMGQHTQSGCVCLAHVPTPFHMCPTGMQELHAQAAGMKCYLRHARDVGKPWLKSKLEGMDALHSLVACTRIALEARGILYTPNPESTPVTVCGLPPVATLYAHVARRSATLSKTNKYRSTKNTIPVAGVLALFLWHALFTRASYVLLRHVWPPCA